MFYLFYVKKELIFLQYGWNAARMMLKTAQKQKSSDIGLSRQNRTVSWAEPWIWNQQRIVYIQIGNKIRQSARIYFRNWNAVMNNASAFESLVHTFTCVHRNY